MASEFTRKVRNINDIKEYPTTYDNNGDVLITKGDEIYMLINDVDKVRIDNRDVEGEIKKATDLSNEAINKADKSSQETKKVSQDLINLKNVDNNFTGNNTFTQPINGILKTRLATFTDFADVAKNMIMYAGNWYTSGKNINNGPLQTGYGVIQVTQGDGSGNGYILFSNWPNNKTYIGYVNNYLIAKWSQIADDGTVIHNTGNETSSGDKTLNGQTTLLNGNYGLRVTNSGIMKTSDAGKTWVNI